MGMALDVAVVEELTRFSVFLSYPLRWPPINWANILLALVFGTSSDGERNQYDRKEDSVPGHFI